MADPIRGSLRGRVVLVTRPRGQAGPLLRALRERGAEAIHAPTIRLTRAPASRLDRVVTDLTSGAYSWAVFTSVSGVEAVLDRVAAGVPTAGAVQASVAAVGEGTAGALRDRGIEPDLVPATFTTSALSRAFPRGTGRVLLARADIAPAGLEEALRSKGWTAERVDAYRTATADRLPARAERALREGRVNAVTFTSASTVTGFVRAGGSRILPGGGRRPPAVVCIGPVTAAAARAAGMRVAAVARPHTIEGLVAALERVLGRPRQEERG